MCKLKMLQDILYEISWNILKILFHTVHLGFNSGITKGCTWLHFFVHVRSGWSWWLNLAAWPLLCAEGAQGISGIQTARFAFPSLRKDAWCPWCASMIHVRFLHVRMVKSFRPASPAYCAGIGDLNETKRVRRDRYDQRDLHTGSHVHRNIRFGW